MGPRVSQLEYQPDSRPVNHRGSQLVGPQVYLQTNHLVNPQINLLEDQVDSLQATRQVSRQVSLLQCQLANLLLCRVDSQQRNQLHSLLATLLDSLVDNPVASHQASLRTIPLRSPQVGQARSRVRSHRDNHRHNLLDNHLRSLQVNQLHSRPRIHQLDPLKYLLPSLLYSRQRYRRLSLVRSQQCNLQANPVPNLRQLPLPYPVHSQAVSPVSNPVANR